MVIKGHNTVRHWETTSSFSLKKVQKTKQRMSPKGNTESLVFKKITIKAREICEWIRYFYMMII